eukprot:1671394-Pleurochrysis_carterae.AAC.1
MNPGCAAGFTGSLTAKVNSILSLLCYLNDLPLQRLPPPGGASVLCVAFAGKRALLARVTKARSHGRE